MSEKHFVKKEEKLCERFLRCGASYRRGGRCCGQTHPVAGLHPLPSQEPLHRDALVRQLALKDGRLSSRHRHVLQRMDQRDGPSWG